MSLGVLREAKSPPNPTQIVRALCHDLSSPLSYLTMAKHFPSISLYPVLQLNSTEENDKKIKLFATNQTLTEVKFLNNYP